MARRTRPRPVKLLSILTLVAGLVAVVLVGRVFGELGGAEPAAEPASPLGHESCEQPEPRYAVAVAVEPGGLWLWTATGELRIDCRATANCTGPDSYDWQELQRRLALARQWHPDLGRALLLSQGVDVATTLAATDAMRQDPAHPGTPLFPELSVGAEGCREVVQQLLVQPASVDEESVDPLGDRAISPP